MIQKLKGGKSSIECTGDNSSGEDTGFVSMSNGKYFNDFMIILAKILVIMGK